MRILTPLACLFLIAACGGDGGSSQATTSTVTPPASGATRIGDIQGTGTISPVEGQSVSVIGIVTGDFQENDADKRRNLGGFYIQDGPPDANLQTSDGIFVFDGNNPATDIDVGEAVETLAHGAEVGEEPAEPALDDVELLAALGFFLDGGLGLLLRPDEEHGSAGGGHLANGLVGDLGQPQG